jgi:hypothetical protein
MPHSVFAAVGQDGLRTTSEDGFKWVAPQIGKEGEVYRAVCFGNGIGVAVGNYGGGNIYAQTTDGKTWKTQFIDAKYVYFLRGLTFGNGKFMALGGDPGSVGSSRPFIFLSDNGEKWGDKIDISGKNIIRRAIFGNKRFVGVGDRGRRAASEDFKTWQDAPEVKAIDTLIDVAFGNGVFVGVGLHGLRMSSTDGLTWSNRQVGEEGEHLNSIVWAKDRFVTVGPGGTFFSNNGAKWDRQPNENAPQYFCHGNGVYVGAAWKGRLLASRDALKWTETMKCDRHVEAVGWGEI